MSPRLIQTYSEIQDVAVSPEKKKKIREMFRWLKLSRLTYILPGRAFKFYSMGHEKRELYLNIKT